MRFLVVGLGSMGKRRIRNLQALGEYDISGFDLREDRRNEAKKNYGITVYDSFDRAVSDYNPNALIISVSPESHMIYAWKGLELKISCFIEASVVDANRIRDLYVRIKDTTIVMAPSCSMRYFPGPLKIRDILKSGRLGRVLNINYQVGQYLPDWHPWESIDSYYVSRHETGGAREIVPFELTWLNQLFGEPKPLACVKNKLTDIAANIDDIYHCILLYPDNIIANITVEVISRPVPTRQLRIICDNGELVYSADDNCVRFIIVGDKDWTVLKLDVGSVEDGYINPEEPYILEIADFLAAAKSGNQQLFPNSLVNDWKVLQVLYKLELLSQGLF